MVVISNHSNYLDSFILYYLFRCGFVSSDFINSSELGKLIATKCKLLIFKRKIREKGKHIFNFLYDVIQVICVSFILVFIFNPPQWLYYIPLLVIIIQFFMIFVC